MSSFDQLCLGLISCVQDWSAVSRIHQLCPGLSVDRFGLKNCGILTDYKPIHKLSTILTLLLPFYVIPDPAAPPPLIQPLPYTPLNQQSSIPFCKLFPLSCVQIYLNPFQELWFFCHLYPFKFSPLHPFFRSLPHQPRPDNTLPRLLLAICQQLEKCIIGLTISGPGWKGGRGGCNEGKRKIQEGRWRGWGQFNTLLYRCKDEMMISRCIKWLVSWDQGCIIRLVTLDALQCTENVVS